MDDEGHLERFHDRPEPAVPGLAARCDRLGSSVVRDILRLTTRKDVISFCGGLPAPEVLPAVEGASLPRDAGQYGATEGETPLREWVAQHLTRLGRPCRAEQVLITSGAQQGLDLCARLLLDEGTGMVCEAPTYLAALQVFRLFGARLQPVAVTPEGIDLERLWRQLDRPETRAAYLVPTFQNPGAHCYPEANRRSAADAIDASGRVLIEDGAYAELSYEGTQATPVCGYLRRAPWLYLGSFSKILMPGLRLGYMVADERLVPHLVRLKQAADLHSSRVGQYLLLDWLERNDYDQQLRWARTVYRERRDLMAAGLDRHFGDAARWSLPGGGLFFWVALDGGLDTGVLLDAALDANVAYTPGAAFFPTEDAPVHWLRLNFSHPSPRAIETGLARLASVYESAVARSKHANSLLSD
ncbi:PLP-dependent aminotransferase family protein [Ectothiorhodospiraceae bacterium WFHF3C12]|nr:PLP-dependent aminotransferase family protein [Ectothiorhodospiraceae bacterium WFHF3C12]